MANTDTLKQKLTLDMSIPGVDERQLPTNQFLIFSIVFVAIYFMVVFYFIYPEVKKIRSTYNRMTRAEAELDKYQARRKKVTEILNNEYYSDEMVETIDGILYDSNPYLEVLLSINELAEQYNLKVSNLEYSPGIVATPSAELASRMEENYPIKFNLTGTYGNIALFLKELEMHAPFNSVSSVKLSNNLEMGSASAQVEILAQYHLPEIYLSQKTISADQALPEIAYPQQEALATLQKMIRKNFGLSQMTLAETSPKLNLFALDDLGITLASEQETNKYYYDPTSGDIFTYTDAGVPIVISPENLPPDTPLYQEIMGQVAPTSETYIQLDENGNQEAEIIYAQPVPITAE